MLISSLSINEFLYGQCQRSKRAIFWKGALSFLDKRASQCCPARCLCWDQRSCIRAAACARRSGRSLLGRSPSPSDLPVLEVLVLERPNGVRGLSRFDVASFRFHTRRSIAVSAIHAAPAWGYAPWALGWPPGVPPGLGLPPTSYKTPPENISDQKSRGVSANVVYAIGGT